MPTCWHPCQRNAISPCASGTRTTHRRKGNMNAFRFLLVILWVLIIGITWYALRELGSEGGMVFVTDFSHPWRAQFYTDFSIHLLLFAIWVFWREQSKVVGFVA